MTLRNYIALNAQRIRKMKGLTQEEFCVKADLSQAQLSRIENGRINIGLDLLERLAMGLEVSPSELVKNPDVQNLSLIEKLEAIEKLPAKKRQSLMEIIDTMLQQEQGSK